jgi:hypothetical protein
MKRFAHLADILILLYFCITVNINFAQINNNIIEESNWGGFFDIGMQNSTVKREIAGEQGIPNNFSGLTLGFGVIHDFYLMGLKFSGEIPDDKKPFINNTTKGEKESHVELMQLSLYAGLISPKVYLSTVSELFMFGHLSFGNMWAFGEERSINGCVDCDVQELDLNGGIYLDPELYFIFGAVGVGFGYRYFLNSDYINKLELKLSIGLY